MKYIKNCGLFDHPIIFNQARALFYFSHDAVTHGERIYSIELYPLVILKIIG